MVRNMMVVVVTCFSSVALRKLSTPVVVFY